MSGSTATGRARGALLAPALLVGCTSFGAVRSAEVQPSPSFMLQASATTRPGDETSWFWSYDCADNCDHSIANVDLGLTFGRPAGPERNTAYAIGIGVSGPLPYVDGYLQLGSGRHPFGLGARAGVPIWGPNEYHIYGRYDVQLESGPRVLLNPGVFYHVATSDNGESRGRVLALVQGIGLMLAGKETTLVPAATLVLARGRRDSYGERTDFTTALAVISASVTFHPERK